MPSVSPIKQSPVARYLVENKAKAHRDPHTGFVEYKNSKNELLGRLYKGQSPLQNYSFISVDIFKPGERIPFLSQYTTIVKTFKYFLGQHKFMPVKIEIEKILRNYKSNTCRTEEITRGLKSDVCIEELEESPLVKHERQKLGEGVPDDFPIYIINKPFRYEFKAHLYYPQRPIDREKPMIKD